MTSSGLLTGILQRLPASWRARLALAAPWLPVARPITEQDSAYDIAHWERFYATVDPWGLAGNPNEEAKHALTLDLCGSGPFDRALEIGCGEGVFTWLLAPRCRSLLAVDISSRAVRRAQARLAQYPGVLVRAMSLPANYPEGPFDLVVASDVLYYWPIGNLGSAATRIADSLAVGGRFVALHFALPMVAVNTGDTVHDVLSSTLALSHVHSERRDIGPGRPYRIDIWDKAHCTDHGTLPTPAFVGLRTGIEPTRA